MREAVLLKVAVPWIPPVRMSPNRRTSDRTIRRDIATARDVTEMAIVNQLRGAGGDTYAGPVHFTFIFCWPPGRKRWDDSNLSGAPVKGIIDAFERKGIIVNDRQADAPTIRQSHDDGQGYVYVELTTRAVAQEAA